MQRPHLNSWIYSENPESHSCNRPSDQVFQSGASPIRSRHRLANNSPTQTPSRTFMVCASRITPNDRKPARRAKLISIGVLAMKTIRSGDTFISSARSSQVSVWRHRVRGRSITGSASPKKRSQLRPVTPGVSRDANHFHPHGSPLLKHIEHIRKQFQLTIGLNSKERRQIHPQRLDYHYQPHLFTL